LSSDLIRVYPRKSAARRFAFSQAFVTPFNLVSHSHRGFSPVNQPGESAAFFDPVSRFNGFRVLGDR